MLIDDANVFDADAVVVGRGDRIGCFVYSFGKFCRFARTHLVHLFDECLLLSVMTTTFDYNISGFY